LSDLEAEKSTSNLQALCLKEEVAIAARVGAAPTASLIWSKVKPMILAIRLGCCTCRLAEENLFLTVLLVYENLFNKRDLGL